MSLTSNQYARDHGMRQFSVYQGLWSCAVRDFERDIIPMCKSERMGICPWGALGGGKFKTTEQIKALVRPPFAGSNHGLFTQ